LIYESSLLVLAFAIFIFAIWNDNNAILAYGQEQAAPTNTTTNPTIKITSPTKDQQIPAGELTITGTSSDDVSSDCTVYADWNDLTPMQKAIPIGPNEFGRAGEDYSTWIFSYTDKYHEIIEGPNELTAKLSCDIGPFNSTKYYSVNVTGVRIGQQEQQQQQQEEKPTSEEAETTATESSEITSNNNNTPFTLPMPSENPDIDNGQSSEPVRRQAAFR
jgi:hypothetical protein